MLRVRASQKWFTEEEVASLFGMALDELRSLAESRHLGIFSRAAEAAGAAGVTAGQLLFSLPELMILSVLSHRLEH